MADPDLRALARKDLNQLVALAALLSAGGVGKAADLLDVSQPTMSKSLARLRRTFDDPLLVRDGRAMHLTPFADELAVKLQAAISAIDALYHPQSPFDPRTVRGWIRIAGNDYVQSVLALPFIRHMREAAPNLHVEVKPVGALYPEQLLEHGVVDIVLSGPFGTGNLHQARTVTDPFACVADAANDAIPDRLSLDAFLARPQVDVTPSGTGILRRYLERAQRRFKDERNIVTVLASFSSLPEALVGTDAVALAPSRMLPVLREGGLREVALDFPLPGWELTLWWHPRTHSNAMQRWARGELLRLAARS